MTTKGMKFDDGKLDYSLLDDAAMDEFVAVLTVGAVKYDADNWRKVPGWKRRYVAAIRRHLSAFLQGEELDAETTLHHLAHAHCDVHFLLALTLEEKPHLRQSMKKRLESGLKIAREARAKRVAREEAYAYLFSRKGKKPRP